MSGKMFMKAKSIYIGVFFVVCLLKISECNVCKIRVNTKRWVPETFFRTVRETYRGNCWYRCTKTRINSYYDERVVLKTAVEYRDQCCQGYIEDFLRSKLEGRLQCLPICSPACENGYCETPGKCTCNTGYEPHLTNAHKCLPVCTNGCDHGICIGPDACRCNFGYIKNNTTCQPICTEPCLNATCVAPDTCECLPGYRKAENNLCLPYCSKGCLNGACTSPETCTCNDGWYKDDDVCKPYCDIGCGGGTCTAPNFCECNANYNKSENGTCVPHCSQGCANGNCVGPDNCVCNEGWVKDDQLNVCSPYCEYQCGGGTCTSPNVCECHAGYILSDNGTCIPHCPQGCPHGQCVNPGICSCENGWHKNETDEECHPICDNECINGVCVEPNKCECLFNYISNENGSCVPYCSKGCPNGTCVSPEICKCDEGWQKNENGICEPHCNSSCGSGNCIEPDVCECFPGYKLNTDSDLESTNTICVPECLGCNGTCSAPSRCVCDYPLRAVFVTEDGQKCECNESCSEEEKICHHIACILSDNYAYTTITTITDVIYDTVEVTMSSPDQDDVRNDEEVTGKVLKENNGTFSYNTDTLKRHNGMYGIPSWVYFVASSVVVILVILSVVICNRKAISHYCEGSSYAFEDDNIIDESIQTNMSTNTIKDETGLNAERV